MREIFYKVMNLKKKEKKTALPIIRYMLYILLVTTTVTGVSLSRYSTTESTSATARVAKFDVTVECINDTSMNDYPYTSTISQTGMTEYQYRITNNSEVSVMGSLVIENGVDADIVVSVNGVDEGNTFNMTAGEDKVVSVIVSTVDVISATESFSFYFQFTQID